MLRCWVLLVTDRGVFGQRRPLLVRDAGERRPHYVGIVRSLMLLQWLLEDEQEGEKETILRSLDWTPQFVFCDARSR